MTTQPAVSFDLAEELIATLRQEFAAERLVDQLERALANTPPPQQARAAQRFFTEYGRRWMSRTLELGERYPDRPYEVLKAVVQRTSGYLAFPLLAERFIEIAYLSTQPLYAIPIVENGARALVFKVPACNYYKGIQEKLGQTMAGMLFCRYGCVSACDAAFRHFHIPVSVQQDATLPKDGFCQFSIRKAA
ncbi:MAG: hypothetical protein HY684_04290 [Chloroflexi bacterium]|nr:hypothetical protein [Chloroflexota bacterium]